MRSLELFVGAGGLGMGTALAGFKSVDGFSNHDPGSGRYGQDRSRWDTLHPGRAWALKCREREETSDEIVREVTAYLKTEPRRV